MLLSAGLVPSIASAATHLGLDPSLALFQVQALESSPAILILTHSAVELANWLAFLYTFRRRFPSCFVAVVVASPGLAGELASLRLECYAHGASMFTSERLALDSAVTLVVRQASRPGRLTCPYCGLKNLTEDALWVHCPLYHIQAPNDVNITCPVCGDRCSPGRDRPFQVHLRNKHGPCGRGELGSEDDHRPDELFAFALVVCVRESDQRMLLVHEFASTGLWLPGGQVDARETLQQAAIRETREEAGVDIRLCGVLKLQYTPHRGYVRIRAVFLARPVDESAAPKSLPDYESAGAAWVTLDDVRRGLYPLRGNEPRYWAEHLLNGGEVFSLDVLSGGNGESA
jgi:8-oxo-dGTP pyrophosphatase MutT (NUDIX family)